MKRGLLAALLAAFLVIGAGATGAAEDLFVRSWRVAGPFSTGSREAMVDPLYPRNFASLDPASAESLATFLAPSGRIGWTSVASETEEVGFAYEGIDWDGITEAWGWAGTVSLGVAAGVLDVPTPGVYLIDTDGVSGAAIDGVRYVTDPYPGGSFRSPAHLDAGPHRVAIRASGGGPKSVRFRLVPADGPAAILREDLTLPDLDAGARFEGLGAAPVVNLGSEDLRGASLLFGGDAGVEETAVEIPPIPGEGILKVPFPIRTTGAHPAGTVLRTSLRILATGGGVVHVPCSLMVRGEGQSRIHTFRSEQDGSVQKYAVLPATPGSAGPFAMILSLHGASVHPKPQVDSYTQKDWAIVVAPTNTRPYGFDWQDWGRRNAIETMEDARGRYPIDPGRMLLTGHSMGGHGTWHVGTAHPDRFAAIAPSAGWASFATYVPFFLRRDALECDPRLLSLWQRAMAPDNPLPLLPNLAGKPVFVLHGEKDESVPVLQGRMLAQRAAEAGARVVYSEIGGAVHWWDRPETPGVDCVDDPELMAFLKSARPGGEDTSAVRFVTCDLGTADRCRWVTVDAAQRPFDRVEVDARIVRTGAEPLIRVRTRGVAALTLDPPGLAGSPRVERIEIEIDGARLRAHWNGGPIHLGAGARAQWSIRDAAAVRRHLGGLKAAYAAPFVLVYGTGGGAEATAAARRLASLEAQAWYLRADGYAPVLPDTSRVLLAWKKDRNLILFGTPGDNALLRAVGDGLPIRIDPRGIEVAGRRYEGTGLAARFVGRNPWNRDLLVEIVGGTDPAGLELAAAANPCYSGSGFPDFVVFDDLARRDGWASFLAAGYWNLDGNAPSGPEDVFFR